MSQTNMPPVTKSSPMPARTWRTIWADSRSYRARLLRAFFVCFCAGFTFAIFGPIDLYLRNSSYLGFSLPDLLPLIGLGMLGILVMSLLLSLVRGKVFDCALTCVFALAVAGYMQGNFLNLPLGTLDGNQVRWNTYTTHAFVNLFCWIALCAIPFIVYYFSRAVWDKLLRFVSILLVGMQAVALIVSLSTTTLPKRDTVYLTQENQFNLSTGNNVIVFILDMFDNKYADAILQDDPHYLDSLAGFTRYDNAAAVFGRTFPSVTYMLTGKKPDYTAPPAEYFREAYRTGTFLPTLKALGASVDLHIISAPAATGPADNLIGQVDNLGIYAITVDHLRLMKRMLQLSAYRYCPHALKASLFLHTNDFSGIVRAAGDLPNTSYVDDPYFFSLLRASGLTVQRSEPNFTLFHLHGPHGPYTMNEFGESVPEHDSPTTQAKGSLYILYHYIDQMKKVGAFDRSTIIVTADHGFYYTQRLLPTSTTPILFVKPVGVSDAEPLRTSHAPVSHEDLQATVIDAMGGDYAPFGRRFQDIGENENRERTFYNATPSAKGHIREEVVNVYKITGDAMRFENWTPQEPLPIAYPYY